jgi:hypothetical protein
VGGVCYFKFIEQFKINDDNEQQKFRVKSWTTNYELGFGIDISQNTSYSPLSVVFLELTTSLIELTALGQVIFSL